MSLTKNQLDILSKYFTDISKLVVASVVIGFFIPAQAVTLPVFAVGAVVAVFFLIWGVRLGGHL